jgi:aspartokinase/homoserine dehydrogenase 1
VALVRVQSAAMVNVPGVAGRILSSLGQAGINVDAVAASMTSLSCSIDGEQAALARRTLRLLAEQGVAGVEDVVVTEGVALLGAVGDGVAADPSIAARLLSCLASLGIAADLVCHGPGDVGLSCAVPEGDLQRALLALHEDFFGAAARAPRAAPAAPAAPAAAAPRRATKKAPAERASSARAGSSRKGRP